jgi:4-alpha-glucanotransferase
MDSHPITEPALEEAAQSFGVERTFWDIWGKEHEATPQALRAILGCLGVETKSEEDLQTSVEERRWREVSRPLHPTVVVGQGAPVLPVVLPAELVTSHVQLEWQWENGGGDTLEVNLGALPLKKEIVLRGQRFVRKEIALPATLPLGYHRLTMRLSGAPEASAQFIVGPEHAFEPEGLTRAAGIAISLYGVRSGHNWGCGDFTDLHQLADWVVEETGASFIALNPLHAIPNRQPYNTSPYLPNSTFYRNHIYLDLEAVEDFAASPCAARLRSSPRVQHEIEALRASQFVEYERVSRLKLRFLKVLFRTFLERDVRKKTGRASEFQAYIEREGELLQRFALHSALDEVLHKAQPEIWNWRSWPEPYQRPDSQETLTFAREHRRSVLFYQYIQWQLDLQLEKAQQYAKEQGLAIGLYHDLALATDRFGSDLWAHREFYADGCRVGSPPDDFSPKGQDWAFPPPNSARHFEDGYRLFVQSIRKTSRHGGALRIDHVMRFFRLYWIPAGMDATEGTYVLDRFEDLMRVLALESVRGQFIVIGEDLGTLPDPLRAAMQRFGMLSYRLFYFERDRTGRFRRPTEYPREALVSITTHDLPTLAGFWRGADIEARRKVGLVPDDEHYREALEERAGEKQKMLDMLRELKLLSDWTPASASAIPELTGDLHNAFVGFLALTPSRLMLLNQEDLFKETEQQNLPGTTAEYPNWRRKMRFAVEELRSEPVRACTRMFHSWVERTSRHYMK